MEADQTHNSEVVPFEEFAKENGQTYWDSMWLMETMGYKSQPAFRKVINDAIASCMHLDIDVADTFRQYKLQTPEGMVDSYKLNRFACYLIVMHADHNKPQVQRLKVYLAGYAAILAEQNFSDDLLERVQLRERLKDGEALMSGAAYRAGVQGPDMGIFKDAGYMGMYNMSCKQLLARRGLKRGEVAYDYMGTVELAANNFRVTQTAERIKNRGLQGLNQTKQAAKEVGEMVRREMVHNGTVPERLPIEENVKKIQSKLRATSKKMKKLDCPKTTKTKRSDGEQDPEN